jgi:serine/threonine protein phosphatase PrpC
MLRAIAAAQAAVRTLPWERDGARAAPSCTLVGAIWDGRSVTIGSVGDSRAYWIGADDAVVLTTDDSWAQQEVADGRLSADDAARHPNAHAITNWIGADAPDERPEIVTWTPAGAGRVIVCSDGLWNYVPDAEDLADLVRSHGGPGPIGVAEFLVAHALACGGHDNVTVAVITVDPESAEGTE